MLLLYFPALTSLRKTKKEVIVVPAPVEKKQPPVIKEKVIEKEEPTSITVDKKGVKVETKKVKVDIKPNQ